MNTEPKTYRLSGYDAIELYEKIKIGIKDDAGNDLFLMDTVLDDIGEKHVVVYRYGMYSLKQPMTMHTLPIMHDDGTRNGREFKRINEITSFPDYVVCCYENDKIVDIIKKELSSRDLY